MAYLNRVGFATSTTGTGSVAVDAAVSGYATPAEAGATNAVTYTYLIEDGSDFEVGLGTYSTTGPTFSRDTVYISKISGTAGTTKLTLSGTAKVYFTAAAEDLRRAAEQGRQTIWMPAASMVDRTTNGAARVKTEMTTNKNTFVTLDFDGTTQEFAQFEIHFPKSWNLSTVTFQPVWTHPSTTTNFGVVWSLAAVARSDDDAGDVAFGTVQTSADTGGTTNDIYIGPESSAITIAGTPTAGDTVQFQIARVPADGADTMAVDAKLIGIRLFYTTNAATDA